MKTFSLFTAALAAFSSVVDAVTISQITGNKFLSPYNGQTVSDVRGLVTAKGPNGIFLRSTSPDGDSRSSESIYVFSSAVGGTLNVGDIITLGGTITEYRSSSAYLFLTELIRPVNVTVVSSGNTVTPVFVGAGSRVPPTQQFTGLDNYDVLGLPNNQSLISVVNPTLVPTRYGLDFWESLSSELVTIRGVRAISKPNNFRDTWVTGDWPVTGRNSRGGLTMTDRDSNPEAIIIGTPLDGTRNPTDTVLGDSIADITGIVQYTFGYYYILPLTAVQVTASPTPETAPPTTLVSSSTCSGLTVGQYNVENLAPSSAHLPTIARDIVQYLRSPDLMFLQEIQDNNGPTNDAVVSANLTLATLVASIAAQGGKNYSFVEIPPVDDTNGGQPGGNIRNAYIYNNATLRLRNANPGSSTEAVQVTSGPSLSSNPGLIDPTNPAWEASRKPLVVQWETLDGRNPFFTVDVHFTSKGGGSSIEGDPRPPVNGGVDQRIAQANTTAVSHPIRSLLPLRFLRSY